MTEKVCESCGMPMRAKEDFGGGDTGNRYCRFCTDETGRLQDFETRYEGTVHFMMSRMNLDRSAAEKLARENMAKMPAWESYFK